MPAEISLLKRLDRAFNPKTVAVVGDKKAMGYMWLHCMKTFRGQVYSVQVDPNEIPGIEAMGVANFASLKDIPDHIDYVLCAVPRPISPRIIADCVEKKVGAVALFTSGFAETETEEGIATQEQITKMARDGDLLLIGPNCMGIYTASLDCGTAPTRQRETRATWGSSARAGRTASTSRSWVLCTE